MISRIRESLLDVNTNLDDIPFKDAGQYLASVVEKVSNDEGKKIVILIDEYDKILVDNINKTEQFKKNRELLRGFYSVIKSLQHQIRFLFITGISRFAKLNIFSALNHLNDLTLDENMNNLCGYTQEEVEFYFKPYLEHIAIHKQKTKVSTLIKNVKEWYNGYSWNGKETVYSPISIISFCEKQEFENYWYNTSVSNFMPQLAVQHRFDLIKIENNLFNLTDLETPEIDKRLNIIGLLWQMGYLTIVKKESSVKGVFYQLNFPNREVREAFCSIFLDELTDNNALTSSWYETLKEGFLNNNLELIKTAILHIYNSLPYDDFIGGKNNSEGFYRSILYVALQVISADIRTEVHNIFKRIDIFLYLPKSVVWILELKFDQQKDAVSLAQAALNQIKMKKYDSGLPKRYKKIHLLGLGVHKHKESDNTIRLNVEIEYQKGSFESEPK